MTIDRAPTGEALTCLHCGKPGPGLDLDHVVNRQMGGSKKRDVPENKVPLCRRCHELKTLGKVKTRVKDNIYQWRYGASDYWVPITVEVDKRHGCLVKSGGSSSVAESNNQISVRGLKAGTLTSATEPEVSGESAEAENQRPGRGAAVGQVGIVSSASAPSSELTHEQRMEIAASIKDAQERRQFRAGDTALDWEKELGEGFWNLYANEFGYTYPSLRNAMRVCEAIPPERRHYKMTYSHHVAVYQLDSETQEAWLERAHSEEWTVSQMREEMRAEGLLPAKTKQKRWTATELKKLVEEQHIWELAELWEAMEAQDV